MKAGDRNGRKAADPRLALELASGATVADAAERAGVAESTAYRRLAEPDFRREVERLRSEMVERAAAKLANGMSRAVDVLDKLLDSPDARVRLRASVAYIAQTVRVREFQELERRVEELERRVSEAVGR